MNWDMIGAVAELAGAIAVVITLAYLAAQIRQNNISARVAAKQEMTKQFADFTDLLLVHPELEDIYQRGNTGGELNDTERLRYHRLMSKQGWYFAAMHFQYSQQNLSNDEWRQSEAMISRQVNQPGFRLWWQARRESYSPNFVAYIESLFDNGH